MELVMTDPNIIINDSFKQIPLSKGKSAIIDSDVYQDVSQFRWYINSCGYAVRNVKSTGKGQKTLFLHHYIMPKPEETMETDHINGDKLDNRKINLRICTKSENQRNKRCGKNSSTGFKGVTWDKFLNKYKSKITYNKKAIELCGEYARLNIID